VITILAAIIGPELQKPANFMAPVAENMTAIGHAFEMYRADWDDYYPAAHNIHEGNPCNVPMGGNELWEPSQYHAMSKDDYGNTVGWYSKFYWEVLAPYVEDFEVFHCPFDTGIGASYGNAPSMWEFWTEWFKEHPAYCPGRGPEGCGASSYVWNGGLGWYNLWEAHGGNDDNPDTFRPSAYGPWYLPYYKPSVKTQSSIQRPHARYLVFGFMGAWYVGWKYQYNGHWFWRSQAWPVLFCDGHYELINYKEFDETADMNKGTDKDALRAWWTPPESRLEP
jgi:hypothetical protein